MATRRLSPRKRQPSLAQLADSAVAGAWRQSFQTFLEATSKHHPGSWTFPLQFVRAWRAKLEWMERGERNARGSKRP
jgi:hypothetical protein